MERKPEWLIYPAAILFLAAFLWSLSSSFRPIKLSWARGI